MKNTKKTFWTTLIVLGTLMAGSAQAGTTSYNNVVVTQIAAGPAYNGDVVIRLNTYNGVTRPACATSTWALRFDGLTDVGKQTYAMLLLAWSTGTPLVIAGEGSCVGGTGSEALRWVRGI